jgi:hypothetical protein
MMQTFDDFGDMNGSGMGNGGDSDWNQAQRANRIRRPQNAGGRQAPKKDDKGNPSLQHVPCKFFMQGRCTAGNSCPFSHEHPENTAVCKCGLDSSARISRARKLTLL